MRGVRELRQERPSVLSGSTVGDLEQARTEVREVSQPAPQRCRCILTEGLAVAEGVVIWFLREELVESSRPCEERPRRTG